MTLQFVDNAGEGPKVAFPTHITPRPTDRFLLTAVLAVQHGTMDPQEFESLTEEPDLPDDLSDTERALLRVYDACECLPDSPSQARSIAEEALELDPGCPDALVLLWSLEDEASDEALRLARDAHASAEARIEELPHWRRGIDDLWRHEPGCRGLVRAHVACALTLWARDERYEAIGMAERVIALNPADNTGMRWHLANWYLIEDAVGKAYRLLREYSGESIGPALSATALVEFLRNGPGQDARKAVQRLAEHNASLLMAIVSEGGPAVSPTDLDFFVPGEVTEVPVWRGLLHDAWRAHPEAFEWLQQIVSEPEIVELSIEALVGLADIIGQVRNMIGTDVIQDMLGDIDPRTL